MLDIKQYKKQFEYSYSLGAFPTLELLQSHQNDVIKVFIHSSFSNQDVIEKIKQYNIDIEINDKIINKLSNKENVYIIGVFKKYICSIDKYENHILLVNPSNMGNLGTIIRTSLGFNIKNIAIIKPAVDIFDPKVIRSSMGSIFKVNICYYDTYEQYIDENKNHVCYSFMLKAKQSLDKVKFNNRASTLIFGNEATGLDDSFLDENSIIINHSKEIDSLNLPTAVGIALYEFNNQIN